MSLLPGSRIETVSRPDPHGAVAVVDFELAGTPYMALNGGPHFTHSPPASIHVLTEEQEDTDRLWTHLPEGGAARRACAAG